ncbi:ATP-binding protein [Kitasatospora sp. MAP5-34]|uniref:ATP-binding protein n=1 Tax=Kitasatospora sp. MAP5-34 TaxID=3035102 RepID=UPI002476BE7D|nr:ATP-binding protein [Kitasatospora sp. MAP5-34]MDH6579810.1 anti-sigma regulatory factor (Ser/Thr protein kinase) [Kitasatospora sp. MAP5-34]
MTTSTEPGVRAVVPATMMLPYAPESASAARRLVRNKLRDWELDALVDDAEVIVSELATNAYRTGCHRRMAVTIRRITLQTVRIAVRDGSRTMPVLVDAGAGAESGRGLGMVHQLTHGHWGVQVEALGKTTHADLRVRAVP